MKTRTLGLVALLAIWALTLAGCNKTPVENPDESAEIANPASVYCEENGGTLQIETADDGSQAWICMFDDGSYCEEWSYQRWECQPGEIMYNTISDEEIPEPTVTSGIYSEEDLAAAEAAIMNVIDNEWEVKVESVELAYAGDEVWASNLEYCQSLNPEVQECAIFTSSFHIPEQDVQMAGAFELNTDISGWSWTLGKNAAGEWEVLGYGFG